MLFLLLKNKKNSGEKVSRNDEIVDLTKLHKGIVQLIDDDDDKDNQASEECERYSGG